MNRNTKTTILAIAAAVIIACITLGVVYLVSESDNMYQEPSVIQTHEYTLEVTLTQPTLAPATTVSEIHTETTEPSSTDTFTTFSQSSTTNNQETQQSTTEKETTKPVKVETSKMPNTKAGIVRTYNSVINSAKSLENGTIRKKASKQSEITDLSREVTREMLNRTSNLIRRPITQTVVFENGTSDRFDSADAMINPINRSVNLTTNAVESAKAQKEDKGYSIEIVLKSEAATFDGNLTTQTAYHDACFDPVDLSSTRIGLARIDSGVIEYTGATIKLYIDEYGRLTQYITSMPTTTNSTCTLGIRTFDATVESVINESYEITY